MTKKLKASKEFVVGKHNIGYVGSEFSNNFYDMEFEKTKPKLKTKILEKNMLDKDILAELKPQETTLGDFMHALDNPKDCEMLKNDYANIFYIRDSKDILWAVDACWHGAYRGWRVNANSVVNPYEWDAGHQVVSHGFGPEKLEPLSLESDFEARIKELESFRVKVEKVLNLK